MSVNNNYNFEGLLNDYEQHRLVDTIENEMKQTRKFNQAVGLGLVAGTLGYVFRNDIKKFYNKKKNELRAKKKGWKIL